MEYLNKTGVCSLLVAVDNFYLDKLLLTYPTWVYCHPEVISMEHCFVFDCKQVHIDDPRWGKLQEVRSKASVAMNKPVTPFRLIPWDMMGEGISQRERMLTGLIRCVSQIHTPWYLKLDADTFANAKKEFYRDEWFDPTVAFIANGWGYTKPGGTIAKMNLWAADVPELKEWAPVEFTTVDMGNGKTKDVHHRMCSWTFFGNTGWTNWAAALCKTTRLPFPSQDTYLSYVQARTMKKWIPNNFRKMGMDHCRNKDGLAHACADVIRALGVQP
jgi:hypothetical protein